MTFNPEIHHRKSVRLKGYDYSRDGVYFVTICSYDKECIFSIVKNHHVILTEEGRIVLSELEKASKIRKEIKIDSYVIMPNHIHVIIFIVGANGNLPVISNKKRVNCHSPLQMRPRSLSTFMVGFKSSVSRKLGYSIWQRNYYDHIIRNEHELNTYRKYIQDNPSKWKEDEYYIVE